MEHPAVTVNLDEDVAIAVFEILSRWSSDGRPLEVADPGEEYALDQILSQLESQLVAPFQPEYRAVVAKAPATLRSRAGVP